MWQKGPGCNDRGSVKITFPTFKRIFGECTNARGWGNVKTGIYGKVRLHDHMIGTAIKKDMARRQRSGTCPENCL